MKKSWWLFILVAAVLAVLILYFIYAFKSGSFDYDEEIPAYGASGLDQELCGQDDLSGELCLGKTDGTVVPSCDSCNTCRCSGGVPICTEIGCPE